MENKEIIVEEKTNQTILLENRNKLSVSGVEKMISAKPDLMQMATTQGNLQVVGTNMEMSKLDLEQKVVEIAGEIMQIRFVDSKQPIFKRIFK